MDSMSRGAPRPWTTRSSPSTPTRPAPIRATIPNDIAGSVAPDSAYNLIGTGGSGGLIGGTNHNLVGVANPGLGDLGYNGGPTQTIPLLPGSPAINSGSVNLAHDPTTDQPLATDQRGPGFPRTVGDTVDIGAVELSPPLAFTVDSFTSTGTGSGNVGDLVYCIEQANANPDPAGSVIQFDPTAFAAPRTITLSSTLELSEMNGPEEIDGPGATS